MTQPPNPYAPPQHPAEVPINPDHTLVLQRIKGMNSMSFVFGLPGLLLQGWGNAMGDLVGNLMILGGAALLVVGLTYYARSRGQHWAFGFLGLLSCLGLLILAVLPKKCIVCGSGSANGRCTRCFAPVAP